MDTVGFFRSSFAKDQEIISKEEVMDGWGIFGDFQTSMLPRASSLNINLDRTSVPRINRKGEGGHLVEGLF
jgi:hypothetical protein